MAGKSAFGGILQKATVAAPAVFNPVAEVVDISGISLQMNTVDATSLDSPNGIEEVVGGLITNDDMTFTVNLLDADAVSGEFTAEMYAREPVNFQHDLNNGNTWSFAALVTGFAMAETVVDGIVSATITLKPTGQPTVAATV